MAQLIPTLGAAKFDSQGELRTAERGTITVDNPFEQTDLAEVFSPERCIFRDEMTETSDPDRFRERCWAMVVRRIGGPLTLPQFVT
jgi:hypothetical protein